MTTVVDVIPAVRTALFCTWASLGVLVDTCSTAAFGDPELRSLNLVTFPLLALTANGLAVLASRLSTRYPRALGATLLAAGLLTSRKPLTEWSWSESSPLRATYAAEVLVYCIVPLLVGAALWLLRPQNPSMRTGPTWKRWGSASARDCKPTLKRLHGR